LQSIQNQNISRELFEVIIVDDVSNVPLSYSDFEDFNLDIHLISVQSNKKWWVNPCVGFNTAFNFINGNKVIIQNAECLHTTDIIQFVIDKLQKNEYIAMSTLSLSRNSTLSINRTTPVQDINREGSMWYAHPEHNPRPLNFCSAIHKVDLDKVGGFDNRFALGISYDDDMFVHNIRRAGINIKIDDSHIVYHQWHESSWEGVDRPQNDKLFHQIKNSLGE
jgi:GT2 family glycosyltransferase